MDNRRTLIIAGVITVVAVILGTMVMSSSEVMVTDSDGVILQSQSERVWAGEVGEFTEYSEKLNGELFNPGNLKFYNDHIFITDWGDLHVKMFDLSGELLSSIVTGEGAAPGEVRQIWNFAVNDDHVWITDGNAHTVHRFRTDGTYVSRFQVEGFPGRITATKDGFLIMILMRPKPFHKFDFEGNELSASGDTLWAHVSNPLGLDGRFAAEGKDNILFVDRLSGFIAYLGEDGTVEKVIETIDRPTMRELPQNKPTVGNGIRPPRMSVRVADVSIESGTLYLNSLFEEDEEEAHSVLDRYDLRSGQYISSIRLPFKVSTAQVWGGRLFVFREAQLYVAQIDWK